MSAEYRKTTRPAPIRTSPSTTILPRWLARLRFGRIDPSDTSGSSRLCAHRMRRVRIKSIRESKHRTRGSFGPAPRLEVVSDPDALHLRVLAHRLKAHLSPDAAHLHPAERRGGIDEFVRVDPHHSRSELSPTPWARRRFCVQRPAPRPYGTPFAIATASSSLANGVTVMNGPKTSSWQIRMFGFSARTRVGST